LGPAELPGSEWMTEYEAELNAFLPGKKYLAICQYDRRRFAPERLRFLTSQLSLAEEQKGQCIAMTLHDHVDQTLKDKRGVT
jgi:hypothetical protein